MINLDSFLDILLTILQVIDKLGEILCSLGLQKVGEIKEVIGN